jgi:steroid 5-alpha reductase family enzyme
MMTAIYLLYPACVFANIFIIRHMNSHYGSIGAWLSVGVAVTGPFFTIVFIMACLGDFLASLNIMWSVERLLNKLFKSDKK